VPAASGMQGQERTRRDMWRAPMAARWLQGRRLDWDALAWLDGVVLIRPTECSTRD